MRRSRRKRRRTKRPRLRRKRRRTQRSRRKQLKLTWSPEWLGIYGSCSANQRRVIDLYFDWIIMCHCKDVYEVLLSQKQNTWCLIEYMYIQSSMWFVLNYYGYGIAIKKRYKLFNSAWILYVSLKIYVSITNVWLIHKKILENFMSCWHLPQIILCAVCQIYSNVIILRLTTICWVVRVKLIIPLSPHCWGCSNVTRIWMILHNLVSLTHNCFAFKSDLDNISHKYCPWPKFASWYWMNVSWNLKPRPYQRSRSLMDKIGVHLFSSNVDLYNTHSFKEWVSFFFLGSWGMNCSAKQTNLGQFVCSVLRFIPHEPRKKHSFFIFTMIPTKILSTILREII